MAHHHGGHCHHHYHHYGYRSSGDADVQLIALLIVVAILIAGYFLVSCWYSSKWNNGIHTCGNLYIYRVCDECGYIEDIYCTTCNYHLAIPEWYKLKEN